MNDILAIVSNGRINVAAPPDWPEGAIVHLALGNAGRNGSVISEDEPETPDQIQDWIRWYRSLEPLEMTPEEEAGWQADRRAQKEFEISTAEQRDRRTEGLFR